MTLATRGTTYYAAFFVDYREYFFLVVHIDIISVVHDIAQG